MDPELDAAPAPLPRTALPPNAPRLPSHVSRLAVHRRARDDSELGVRRNATRPLYRAARPPEHAAPVAPPPPSVVASFVWGNI